MKIRKCATSVALFTVSVILLMVCTLGCDEGMNMMDDVVTKPTEPEQTDPVVEVPTTTGDMKKPESTEPESEKKEPEPGLADMTAPTVLKVGWYSEKRLFQFIIRDKHPGDTGYIKVVFSEPVEHIVGDDASARPTLSLVVGGQATRLRVLPHDAGDEAFVSGTCKPLKGDTDTFSCRFTVPEESIGTIALQVGKETADIAGNTAAELLHIAPFMIVEEPEPMVVLEVVPALKTLLPPTRQEHPLPENRSGGFVGQIRTLYSTDGTEVNSTQPIAGVSVTITAGSRAGEQVTTDQGGYYLFPNVNKDELYLRVEKEYFEPKEVIVHRARPTVLREQTGPVIERKDPWNTPGTIVIGQRWPDAIRFIFRETLLPSDLLLVIDDGYKSPDRAAAQYQWEGPLQGVISIRKIGNDYIMLLMLGHELGHAHQHAITANSTDWTETPEGRAYAQAREKDWDEVGKSPLDQFITKGYREDLRLSEGAAEVSSLYWGRGIWAEKGEVFSAWRVDIVPGKRDLETMAPNRYKWAEEWLKKR